MLSFEKLTCFPGSGPASSGLGPLYSLVPVWARAGELKQGVWTALCQKSREPLILTVLQPPTQGMGSGWREGRMPRQHETSIWDTAQKALRWRIILEQDDQNLWRWSQLICRYNTLQDNSYAHQRWESPADRCGRFIYSPPPPSPPKEREGLTLSPRAQ